jgi:flagellar biosynthetic protein FliO
MEVMQQVAAVGAVLVLLGATLWWLRRRGYAVSTVGRRRDTRRLQCVERVALGPQQTLHLVRLGDRALLVGFSPAGCTLLDNSAWRESAAPPEIAQ